MVPSNDLIPRNMRIQSISKQKFDPILRDRIDQLNSQKLQAVEEEDFDAAKHYKGLIDKFMIMGNQLLQLQAEKQLAIENEDYDMAKHVKIRME